MPAAAKSGPVTNCRSASSVTPSSVSWLWKSARPFASSQQSRLGITAFYQSTFRPLGFKPERFFVSDGAGRREASGFLCRMEHGSVGYKKKLGLSNSVQQWTAPSHLDELVNASRNETAGFLNHSAFVRRFRSGVSISIMMTIADRWLERG